MLADRYDAVLCDLDGVVYRGEEPVPGAAAAIDALRERGVIVRFVTNDSRSRPERICERLAEMGVPADPADVVTAASATAEVVADGEWTHADVVGSDDLRGMLADRGLATSGGVTENDDTAATDEDTAATVDTAVPDVVVVGYDHRIDHDDVRRATRHVYEDGADFVAVNTDARFPGTDGVLPGTGAFVAAIERATGVEPTVVGKPEPRVFEVALEGLDPEAAVMVGDNPVADVEGARAAGIDAILVTEGPTSGAAHDGADLTTAPSLAALVDGVEG